MNRIILFVLLFFFFSQTSIAQGYLLDSITTVTLFNGSSGGVFSQKYAYDDQFRISSITSEFQIREYQYSNQFDHIVTTSNIEGTEIYSKVTNTFNSNGDILTWQIEIFDQQTQSFNIADGATYSYDQNGNIVLETLYNYSSSGQEQIDLTNSFEYNTNQLLKKEIETRYGFDNSVQVIITKEYSYTGEKLTLEEQDIDAINGNYSHIKTFEYDDEDRLESFLLTSFNEADSSFQKIGSYEYSGDGISEVVIYNNLSGNPYSQIERKYTTNAQSLFFDKDTLISDITINDELFSSSERYNSEIYSVTEDSVAVRYESRSFDENFGENTLVSKQLHIRYPGVPSQVTEKETIVGNIFPNPAKANSTLTIQRDREDIDRVEIYNVLGQKVKSAKFGSGKQMLVSTPQITGNYYVVYFSGQNRIGKIGKLVVN